MDADDEEPYFPNIEDAPIVANVHFKFQHHDYYDDKVT